MAVVARLGLYEYSTGLILGLGLMRPFSERQLVILVIIGTVSQKSGEWQATLTTKTTGY